MCGIVGTVGGAASAVERALQTIRHRGPDAQAVVTDGAVVLGHARLAIIDLDDRSAQPFKRGQLTLAYNGELWNYRELRAELTALGEEFRTPGDTEVVAAALARWGDAALPKFNGMFAIAWTSGDGEWVRLARDRFGEVPLHYAAQAPLYFASEARALLALGADPTRIVDVGPGEIVESDGRRVRSRRWVDVPALPKAAEPEEAAEELLGLLRASVEERRIADVPVCALLSGGVDSGAIAALLRPHVPDLVAYTAVFDAKSRDLRGARETAEMLGVRLVEVPVECPSAEDLARVVDAIEMPFKSQVEIAWACMKLAERMSADGFKVTFSGEGADELFGSYGFAYHGIQTRGWHGFRKESFLGQSRKNFPRANKVFMRSSVECRLPFLNPALVERVLSFERPLVQRGSVTKAVLRDAMRGLLPESVLRRPKVAFQDGMGLKRAIESQIADPRALYARAHQDRFGGWKP